jgi:protein TonB
MFAQLLASRPLRQRSTPQLAASVAFHGVLVAGVALGTTVTPPLITPTTEVPIVYVPTQPLAPSVPAPPAPPTHGDPPPTMTSGVTLIPNTLPPITAAQIGPPPITVGAFTPRPLVPAPPATPPSHTPGTAYLAAEVEQEVAIEGGSPMPRYPAAMRSAGVEGSARVRFVVDTLGLVEPATVETVSATNGMFEMAVLDVLPRMRFRPARVGGRAVRQLVEFPVAFKLAK